MERATRVGALDLGTNTFLCLVADVIGGRVERVLSDEATVVRLGQGVDSSKALHPEALKRADECLARYSVKMRELGVERVVACATSAARDAKNASELLAIGRQHGIPIDVISGALEGALTYAGTVGDQSGQGPWVIDVGGGSTEIILGSREAGAAIAFRESVDAGSVRLTERALPSHPVSSAQLQAAREWVRSRIAASPVAQAAASVSASGSRTVFAVAGTATSLAALDQGRPFDAATVDGYRMSVASVDQWAERLAKMSVDERRKVSGMDAGRADVIVAGAICLAEAAKAIGAQELTVSVRGLRYGLAVAKEKLS